MEGQKKTIIFDCDGTVLDTFKLIEQVVIKTFQIILPSYHMTEEEAHTFFGPFLNDTFKKYFDTEEEVDYAVQVYRKLCFDLTPTYVKAYDGILDLLKYLKENGYLIAMVSNKVTEAILQGLDLCKITNYFDYIVGAEKLKVAKPDPDGIYQVLAQFSVQNSILVGDTLIDMATAKNAEIEFIGVTWCKTTKKIFMDNNVKYIAEHPSDIRKILESKV